ncbi:unnamed protein product [Cylindrotheca closterium]|uniref:Uncharacterized protein n=1 Tax=Cylindrotheca closterium TaxID=2856 RepID=A0AAD2GBV8_9STRA|nr:unnamed protein product [Cylindrotheca closterium]
MQASIPLLTSYARPALIVICGMLLFNLPTLIYKSQMFLRGVAYILLCNDKSWKKPDDPSLVVGPLLEDSSKIERKTVYFVRHGESTWNDTFNKGSHRSWFTFILGWYPGLIKAVLYELYLFLAGKLDSWFYDAPLSNLGIRQAEDLSKFLNEQQPPKEQSSFGDREKFHLSVLTAQPGSPPSKLVCSNLRRAISTVAAAFQDRLSRRPQEKILIIPVLQEISRNPDALSLTPAHAQIHASWMEKTSTVCDFQNIFTNQVDMSLHSGNKPIGTNGLKRMNLFCDFLFSPSVTEDYVIVGGHSLWFRSFFQTFLPYTTIHASQKKKIVNGGVVAFEFVKANTKYGPRYMIDPKSIDVVYGGFH